ncbi:MAG: hypothetical protein AAF467_02680 [Actinomycetota bacterium]
MLGFGGGSDPKRSSPIAGLVTGPVVLLLAIAALFLNETRFDYHQAAASANEVQSPREASAGETIAFSGPMDQSLTLDGDFAESFRGYLRVERETHIYAWTRDPTSESDTDWFLAWRPVLEANPRNEGLSQRLRSATIEPPTVAVGDLTVDTTALALPDGLETIDPAGLRLPGDLDVQGDWLYLSKGRELGAGDERMIYRGVPVPASATWFGSYNGRTGVADTTSARDAGTVNELIEDSGVLHHLAAGDRDEALATIAADIGSLKKTVRWLGLLGTVLGIFGVLSGLVRLAELIPGLRSVAGPAVLLGQVVALVVSIALGVPIALAIIGAGFIAANPVVAALVFAVAVAAALVVTRRRPRSGSGGTARSDELDNADRWAANELAAHQEASFLERAQMAMHTGSLSADDRVRLLEMAAEHGWSERHTETLLTEAEQVSGNWGGRIAAEQRLVTLVNAAGEDNELTDAEVRAIRRAAARAGLGDTALRDLFRLARAAQP